MKRKGIFANLENWNYETIVNHSSNLNAKWFISSVVVVVYISSQFYVHFFPYFVAVIVVVAAVVFVSVSLNNNYVP